ncbi:hypothetical protein C2G38_2195749, partial [Gigaspora rosea]
MRFMNPNNPVSSEILPLRMILTPNLSPRITTIIDEAHAIQIASWIDKKPENYSVTNNPYGFKLLLRGSRDGFTADTFWNSCDKKSNTVIVMKVKGTDEILGGYNSIAWDKFADDRKNCNKNFIFSLKNGNIKNSILSNVINPKHAICCYNLNPGFGFGLRMREISAKLVLTKKTVIKETINTVKLSDDISQITDNFNQLSFNSHQKSTDMNDPDGMYKLGYCYEYGIGTEKDENQAFKYYKKSADMNNPKGIYQVGYCYYLGIGVEIDKHKAFTYYLKSAEAGNSMGIWKTAICYLYGIG